MTFEEILTELKAGKKAVRTKGWSGAENYVKILDHIEDLSVTPYFLISVKGEAKEFSMWAPTACDVLAEDWIVVTP